MKSHYRAVVIGGGVVGASVLYHLAKFGWKDVCLIERNILTAGSSWHAAGGIHALNADPNIASLQAYTIDLLSEIQEESGQDIGLHMTGGLTMAGTPDRWEWLQSAYRVFQSIGIEDCELLTPSLAASERTRILAWWKRRQRLGKPLNFARLAKASTTFEGAARYAAWKIERHTGLAIEVTPFRERYPLLAAPGVLWALRKHRKSRE